MESKATQFQVFFYCAETLYAGRFYKNSGSFYLSTDNPFLEARSNFIKNFPDKLLATKIIPNNIIITALNQIGIARVQPTKAN